MNANLNFLTAPTPNALQIGANSPAHEVKPSAGRSMLGKEFANLMRGLLPEGERQDLAAAGSAASQAGLQTLALGKQFSVITVDAPQPDADSLAAFAKAQGLDDKAVQALFGDIPPIKPSLAVDLKATATVSTDITTNTNTDTNTEGLNWLKDHPGDLMGSLAAMTPPNWFVNPLTPQPGAILPTTPTLTPTLTLTGAAAAPASSLALGAQPLGTNPASGTDAASTDSLTALLAASGAAATVAQISKAEAKAPVAPPPGFELPPEPGPLDVMRMRLMPAWETMTRSLAKAAGSDAVFPWAAVAAGLVDGQTNGVKTLDIDLGDVDGLAAIGSATDTGNGAGTVSATFNNDNSAQMTRASEHRPTLTLSAQSQVSASAGDRAEQISQLSDKLGQALSERLQDQMEQGQWKLELRLKPAHLGKISVELDMRAGGLDALFKSDNPLTRELIAQSAPKLRDNLAQAGMAVANVWVNSDGQGQTGGNPTPRQTSTGVRLADQTLSNPADMKVQAPRAKSTDGWDELV